MRFSTPPVPQSTLITYFFAVVQLQFARASLIDDPNPDLLRLTQEYTTELLSLAYALRPEKWKQAQSEVQVAFQDRALTSEQLETMIFNSMSHAVLLGPEDPAAQVMVLITAWASLILAGLPPPSTLPPRRRQPPMQISRGERLLIRTVQYLARTRQISAGLPGTTAPSLTDWSELADQIRDWIQTSASETEATQRAKAKSVISQLTPLSFPPLQLVELALKMTLAADHTVTSKEDSLPLVLLFAVEHLIDTRSVADNSGSSCA